MSRYSRTARLQPTRCTIQMESGDFCDAERAPDMPFAICPPHAVALYRRMHELVTEVQANPRAHLDVVAAAVEGVRERYNRPEHRVYYVRIGDLIKIGMTENVAKRIASYPPGAELLAVERGGEDLEGQRLRQFHHLLAGRKEWFRPGADLLDHIASLPVIT